MRSAQRPVSDSGHLETTHERSCAGRFGLEIPRASHYLFDHTLSEHRPP
jgi:hypothetical protein